MDEKRQIIGRGPELRKLQYLVDSPKSEFLAVYGRRRVGKTFLIREWFGQQVTFHMTGLANASTKQQLANFQVALAGYTNAETESPPSDWFSAFQRLRHYLTTLPTGSKKVVFIDEMPWFDTKGSDFVTGLEHFWNSWASSRDDILLIACGSASSWMVNVLINNPGGLHNRITQRMKIEPFCLQEAEAFLQSKGCAFDRYQVCQLYMALGGIPYYLDAVRPGLSAPQVLQELLFDASALLQNEFMNLYRSLFKRHEIYEKVVAALATKTVGLPRRELATVAGLPSGGTLTKVLADLEENGFIRSYTAFDGTSKNAIYRLADQYTAFYFRFVEGRAYRGKDAWLNSLDTPAVRTWQGFAFEQLAIDHVAQLKKALGIQGVASNEVSWRGASAHKAAQIDLLIDRRDQVINVVEAKFSVGTFVIDKDYADKLRDKLSTFKQATNTRKALFLTMLTTYGVEKNKHTLSLVQNDITMDALFEPR